MDDRGYDRPYYERDPSVRIRRRQPVIAWAIVLIGLALGALAMWAIVSRALP